MTDLEQNTAIANEAREVIDADFAVGMVRDGFHVFIDNTNEPLTYDMVFGTKEMFDLVEGSHVFTAPMMEVAQESALESLCGKFDSLNDDVRDDGGMSLEDYANELYDEHDDESQYRWRGSLSEWENIRNSILSDKTEYLQLFLNDVSLSYPSRATELREDLGDYTAAYLLKGEDNTFAYKMGHSEPFTVVMLDISINERKTAVTEALNNIINNTYGKRNRYGEINPLSQSYRNLLDNVQSGEPFLKATQGHLSSLKYALYMGNTDNNKELCMKMLDSIKRAENAPETVITIKGQECRPTDTWEDHSITYNIGQSVDNLSFYYARVSDGVVTREYEYDHKPDREKVMSDHADKMAEAYIDHYEAEHGADGYAMFPDTEARAENIRQMQKMEKQVEHIPQQQDISHKLTNADLSAKRGESRGNIMEQKTKFEVSTMSKLEGDGPAKAIGTLVVNGEFAVHGVKVMDGRNGLYVAMPSEKRNGEYQDVVFPVTKEARASIDNAVLATYEKLAASPEKTLKNEIATPEKPVSKVYAQMHAVDSETSQTKAAGQMTIDSCLVVTGIKLNEGTNKDGQTKTFVAMPGKPNENGEYDDVAHPITADFHNKVDKAVIASANNIGRYEYKGVKYAELGENPASSTPLHPKFADKLMAELDKAGIPYQAKCAERVVISVKADDKQAFENAKKDLTAKLNGKDKPQHKQEQTTGTASHKH